MQREIITLTLQRVIESIDGQRRLLPEQYQARIALDTWEPEMAKIDAVKHLSEEIIALYAKDQGIPYGPDAEADKARLSNGIRDVVGSIVNRASNKPDNKKQKSIEEPGLNIEEIAPL